MEFPCAFNEEPLQAFAPFAARAGETGIVAGAGLAPHNSWRERQPIPEEDAMPARKLSEAEIKTLLSKAKGWSLVNGKLHREFACKDFVTAFGNMTCVALVAEAMNHHPEWFNVWNKVVIDLNTHSVKGISDFDFVLAEKINEIFEPFPPLRLPGSGKGQ
ncbi:MAG TPA: 4a-hydroxytetrahydrobiopterin dehydratase [Candidatus Acidoferrum sp.]